MNKDLFYAQKNLRPRLPMSKKFKVRLVQSDDMTPLGIFGKPPCSVSC